MTKIEWQSSTNDALKSLEDMESLEEAKKAIKQNEDAIRLLAEQRDKAKWSAEERLQAFYGIQEHSNDMWFLLLEILEKEPITDKMAQKIHETIYPKIEQSNQEGNH